MKRKSDSSHSLKQALANYSQDELIELIEQMIDRYPDLRSLLPSKSGRLKSAASAPATSNGQQAIDLSHYKRQTEKALKRDDMDEIAEDLQDVINEAHALLKQGDALNAGRLYQMLLDSITASYDNIMMEIDYDGAVACVSQDAAEGIGHCFAQAKSVSSETRMEWLDTLLDAFLRDVAIGGMDYGYGATEALLEYATDAEWAEIEQQLRVQLKRAGSWERETIVQLMAARREQVGEETAANEVIHELGSPKQQAFLLLQEGKLEQAIAIANQNFTQLPGLVTQFADALLAKAPELAFQYMTQQPLERSQRGYQEWFANYHRQYSDPEMALNAQMQLFEAAPSFTAYKTLKQLADRVGHWQQIQPQVVEVLESKKYTTLLIDIALDEQDLNAALIYLKRLPTLGSNYVYWQKVAKAAEKTHPQTAIGLYQQMVAGYIAQKGRSAYQSAVPLLKEIQSLFIASGNSSDWSHYINQIYSQHKNLPALQDELRRAKLKG